MWTVTEAKAKLSEVLRRARAGEAQFIGEREPCVVLSLAEYRKLKPEPAISLGQWLVANPMPFLLEVPSREQERPDPFA